MSALDGLAGGLRARIVPGIAALPAADWTAGQPDDAEGWDYYRACGSDLAAGVFDEHGLVLGLPLFRMEYRLDTPFQGRLAVVGRLLDRLFPRLMRWGMLGVGSPLAERCHVSVRPGLTAAERAGAVDAMLALLEEEAARTRALLVVFKDVSTPEADWLAPLLTGRRFTAVSGLPVAQLDLAGLDVGGYLARLSAATRKDVRRKLKSRAAVRVEHRERIDDVADKIEALYESTRQNSQLRYGEFEDLPPGYFRNLADAMPGRAHFVLYWVGGSLAAFNLLFVEPDRVIDKFLGMAYPLARDHNLYAVSWMENVRWTIAAGRSMLQSGQTAYAAKLRFGSSLLPSTNFVRCRNRLLDRIIRLAAPWLAFDRWDPDLRQRREREEGREERRPRRTASP
ncbi:hypothetical protein AZL_a10380 (plasmid) [Azospirillum sp. B510]|uniref:GNAT family N-acetyltransferase n=1 Tax=Azospirillum sp. (strain B510) TaxID=137722 RepID=UPI0001C4B7F0|nr:GNAT family N-acetyltransferase [Azospirillum sp. B510]BAI74569.1 hypothetical protein AZL_a10380 [Azospirillum sp. B510]